MRAGGFELKGTPLTDLHVIQWTLDEAVVILHGRACAHKGLELLPWLSRSQKEHFRWGSFLTYETTTILLTRDYMLPIAEA